MQRNNSISERHADNRRWKALFVVFACTIWLARRQERARKLLFSLIYHAVWDENWFSFADLSKAMRFSSWRQRRETKFIKLLAIYRRTNHVMQFDYKPKPNIIRNSIDFTGTPLPYWKFEKMHFIREKNGGNSINRLLWHSHWNETIKFNIQYVARWNCRWKEKSENLCQKYGASMTRLLRIE